MADQNEPEAEQQHDPDFSGQEYDGTYARTSETIEVEVVDGEIVFMGEESESERSLTRGSAPVMQTAVAAATGFVAGAATLMLLRRYGPRASRLAREAELEQSRRREHVHLRRGTYLIHIRTLAPPE